MPTPSSRKPTVNLLPARDTSDQSADAAAAAGTETGFGGRTVAEDTQAVRTGITPPPPAARITDADSTDAL